MVSGSIEPVVAPVSADVVVALGGGITADGEPQPATVARARRAAARARPCRRRRGTSSAVRGDSRGSRSFDLITCVHGLHYIGDKLAALARAASWLTPGGLLVVADLDLAGIRVAGQPASRRLSRALRDAGFSHDFRRHRVYRTGRLEAVWPYRYLGADDRVPLEY